MHNFINHSNDLSNDELNINALQFVDMYVSNVQDIYLLLKKEGVNQHSTTIFCNTWHEGDFLKTDDQQKEHLHQLLKAEKFNDMSVHMSH